MKEINEYSRTGMRSPAQLIEFILNKPDDVCSVNINSDNFSLDIPVNEKDVMCMKVIDLIKNEYGDHTGVEVLEMLQDTIWWLQTFTIAFSE